MAKNPETMNELIERMLSVFPDAYVEEMSGEIVIQTGLRETSHGTVEPVPEEEDIELPMPKLEALANRKSPWETSDPTRGTVGGQRFPE